MLESAKDLTIEAAVSALSRLTDTPSGLRQVEIPKLLNSRLDRDILTGMKCVIAATARGEDGLPYFADVVKNVTTSNESIRNLVLIYLTRYAEVEPDTALLLINSIQKSLNEKNAISRAKAIRALAGIRISSILPIVLLCIKRTLTDPSPLVRSATAIAIGKAFDIDDLESSSKKQMVEYLTKLLSDSDSSVVSTAIKTFYKLLPQFSTSSKIWDPIHGNFRRFCSIINEFDEWSQGFLIDILTEYSRRFLPRPKLYLVDESNQVIDLPEDYSQIPFSAYEVSFDEDLNLFLNSLKVLLYSRLESVILAVARAVYFLAPPLTFKDFQLSQPLVRIASTSRDSQISLFALQIISSISWKDQSIFVNNVKNFYVYPSDLFEVASSKLDILASLAQEKNIKYILEELKYYTLSSRNSDIAREAIISIGRCSQLSPEWNRKILRWCLKQIQKTTGSILNELLTVVRYLIQQKNSFTLNVANERDEIINTTYQLSLILRDSSLNLESDAKASIVWIIGEFTGVAENAIGPDVLRHLIKGFSKEEETTRYQILMLAAKVASYEVKRIKTEAGDDEDIYNQRLGNSINYKMFQHALHLAKYDNSYDTRDRARMLNILLNSSSSMSELATLFLQVPKPVPVVGSKKDASLVQARALEEYLAIRDWSEADTLPKADIRKEAKVIFNSLGGAGISSFSSVEKSPTPPQMPTSRSISSESYLNSRVPEKKQTYHLQSLDDFFGNDESEESSSEDEEDDEEEEEDEDEDEDENEDNEEDDDEDDEEDDEEVSSSDEEQDSHELDNYASDSDTKRALLSKE